MNQKYCELVKTHVAQCYEQNCFKLMDIKI